MALSDLTSGGLPNNRESLDQKILEAGSVVEPLPELDCARRQRIV
ncbi:unannotated protein [freshwater metagenome]|uniref:Unannotated protein n=1 Tax=freshwater metagenome TaxID=449393 RepID=A0A6J5YIR7_9ZZZZ